MDEPCRLSPPKEGAVVPKLIVYDLEDTVWFPELYMMCGAPW
jgi:magnesium-dependent phosphatase 1